jgi:hypothetical protein
VPGAQLVQGRLLTTKGPRLKTERWLLNVFPEALELFQQSHEQVHHAPLKGTIKFSNIHTPWGQGKGSSEALTGSVRPKGTPPGARPARPGCAPRRPDPCLQVGEHSRSVGEGAHTTSPVPCHISWFSDTTTWRGLRRLTARTWDKALDAREDLRARP